MEHWEEMGKKDFFVQLYNKEKVYECMHELLIIKKSFTPNVQDVLFFKHIDI